MPVPATASSVLSKRSIPIELAVIAVVLTVISTLLLRSAFVSSPETNTRPEPGLTVEIRSPPGVVRRCGGAPPRTPTFTESVIDWLKDKGFPIGF